MPANHTKHSLGVQPKLPCESPYTTNTQGLAPMGANHKTQLRCSSKASMRVQHDAERHEAQPANTRPSSGRREPRTPPLPPAPHPKHSLGVHPKLPCERNTTQNATKHSPPTRDLAAGVENPELLLFLLLLGQSTEVAENFRQTAGELSSGTFRRGAESFRQRP